MTRIAAGPLLLIQVRRHRANRPVHNQKSRKTGNLLSFRKSVLSERWERPFPPLSSRAGRALQCCLQTRLRNHPNLRRTRFPMRP